jgi:hypothetical protein
MRDIFFKDAGRESEDLSSRLQAEKEKKEERKRNQGQPRAQARRNFQA